MLSAIRNMLGISTAANSLSKFDPELTRRARTLTEQVEVRAARVIGKGMMGQPITGERKKNWVMDYLTKEYPNINKRDLSLIVELILQEK